MSFALRAAVLIKLQAESGGWRSLTWIVSQVVRPLHEVEQICLELVAAGELNALGHGERRMFSCAGPWARGLLPTTPGVTRLDCGTPMPKPSHVQQWPKPPGEADGVAVFQVPPRRAELLEWHDAATTKPDADILQLLWIADEVGHCDWDAGWWSGEEWLLAESGGSVAGRVLFFASPEGPDQ